MLEKHHLGQAMDLHYNINGKLLELKRCKFTSKDHTNSNVHLNDLLKIIWAEYESKREERVKLVFIGMSEEVAVVHLSTLRGRAAARNLLIPQLHLQGDPMPPQDEMHLLYTHYTEGGGLEQVVWQEWVNGPEGRGLTGVWSVQGVDWSFRIRRVPTRRQVEMQDTGVRKQQETSGGGLEQVVWQEWVNGPEGRGLTGVWSVQGVDWSFRIRRVPTRRQVEMQDTGVGKQQETSGQNQKQTQVCHLGVGRPGDSDEEAQTPDMLSALVKPNVDSLGYSSAGDILPDIEITLRHLFTLTSSQGLAFSSVTGYCKGNSLVSLKPERASWGVREGLSPRGAGWGRYKTSNIVRHRKDAALRGLPVFLREEPKDLFKQCLLRTASRFLEGKSGPRTELDEEQARCYGELYVHVCTPRDQIELGEIEGGCQHRSARKTDECISNSPTKGAAMRHADSIADLNGCMDVKFDCCIITEWEQDPFAVTTPLIRVRETLYKLKQKPPQMATDNIFNFLCRLTPYHELNQDVCEYERQRGGERREESDRETVNETERRCRITQNILGERWMEPASLKQKSLQHIAVFPETPQIANDAQLSKELSHNQVNPRLQSALHSATVLKQFHDGKHSLERILKRLAQEETKTLVLEEVLNHNSSQWEFRMFLEINMLTFAGLPHTYKSY
ncbi:hypothetical protein PAMA_021508 [Pampus argenteus]